MIGSSELMIVIVVIVVLFGASAIPKFAKSLGQAKAEFEKGFKATKSETQSGSDSTDKRVERNDNV